MLFKICQPQLNTTYDSFTAKCMYVWHVKLQATGVSPIQRSVSKDVFLDTDLPKLIFPVTGCVSKHDTCDQPTVI